MREIKFRSWDGKRFHFWGFLRGGCFDGPRVDSGALSHPQEAFTGLHDKTGKEIYEGDIVRLGVNPSAEDPDGEEGKATILFDRGQFRTDYYGFPVYSWCKPECFIEVIGNIHQDPTLLKAVSDNG